MTTAVVIGGGSGIGAAVTSLQREKGIKVVVWDVKSAADIQCDITDPTQIDQAVIATVDAIGCPDLVTVTAGIGHSAMLVDATVDDWNKVLTTNLVGPWLAMRALAGPMGQHGSGSMVATSSISGRLADRSMGLYCSSKAALDMLIRVAAREWAPALRVNGVAPGATDTPMLGPSPRESGWLRGVARRTSLQRLGTPHDIAQVIVGIHEMPWLTGEIVVCDGGLSQYSSIDPLGR